ncbi:MAG: Na/Pi symporter [Candidatus Eiseniibacteriota bacterium]|jgi:sodium-dependent phosphate cotransporter
MMPPGNHRVTGTAVLLSVARALLLCAALFAFFVSIKMIGISFKLFGADFAQGLLATTSSPFVGLVVGILATTLMQSSSATTSITVGLVAAGGITVHGAVPIIMGANIGTSVTNTIVSMGHISRRQEFRRAVAGATVHDFFNLLVVVVLFPLELATGYLARTAGLLTRVFQNVGGLELISPLDHLVKPCAGLLVHALGDSGILGIVAALVLLFTALRLLTGILRVVVVSRISHIINRYLFRSGLVSLGFGVAITVLVQSSSVTTSLVVPLVASGLLTLEQIFPYTLGANLGTTVTALLAALVTAHPGGLTAALVHLLFNLTGIVMVLLTPLKRVPLALARGLARHAERRRLVAVAYLVVVFYLVPLGLVLLSRRH